MSFVRFITFANEKDFAKLLATRLADNMPVDLIDKRDNVISVNKITRRLERIYLQAGEYQREHRIGLIGQAVMANTFKWELKTVGYSNEFIDMATEGLVVELAKVGKLSKS